MQGQMVRGTLPCRASAPGKWTNQLQVGVCIEPLTRNLLLGQGLTSSPSGLTSFRVTELWLDAVTVHVCRDHPSLPPCNELRPSLALTW